MKKRIISLLLVLCLAVALVPMAVLAADGDGKAIRSGIGDIVGYNSTSRTYNYIYYGTWRDSPIKWRVLDTKTNTGETGALFLMTDECLYPLPGDLYVCYIQFNPANKPNRHLWKDSTLQDWFKNTFYSGENSAFTSAERALIPATTQASSVYSYKAPNAPSYFPPMRFQICALEAEHVFAPSIQDIMNADYGFIDSTSRIAGPIDSSGRGTRYWLRSFEISEQLPFCVGHDASLNGDYGDNSSAVRPAMNLSTAGNNILFISAAEGGKPAGGLAEIPEYTGNEWKLTLKDSSRSGFSVTTAEVSTSTKGGTVEISYSDAKTGANEYISVLLKDSSGNPTYYGRSNASLTEKDGTAQLTIPAGFAEGTYTMKVFNEQYNGDCKTDLASGFADVTLTVEKRVEEQFTLTPGGRYYFDLSAMDIPGTVNSNLPDGTLHYVPFTYAGTVDAYVLKPASNHVADSSEQASVTTDKNAQYGYAYEHSLFIADYRVTTTISWIDLNNAGFIFGKTYTAGGINYTLRAPTMGSIHKSSQRGNPANNEWDQILTKNSDFIKELGNNEKISQFWGQDTRYYDFDIRKAARNSVNNLFGTFETSYNGMCYRPVLELPTDLAADSLKVVKVSPGVNMADDGGYKSWIDIIVKKGESFKAPSAEGLPRPDGISADASLWWEDENGNFYKPGDTVPANVSALYALWGGFGLLLNQGDGEVEVTPDNYTDIFGDGTASFVLPKGRSLTSLLVSGNLTSKDILEIYSTGKLERDGSVFPNLKLKNADLTSVSLSEEYIGCENPLFITPDGKNTVGSLNGIIESMSTLCVIGDGSLTLNSALTLGRYTQYGGGSVTMADGLTAYFLTIDSGSLTVTGDPQAITLRNQALGDLQMGDGVRLFTGSSAQDATEAVIPQLSAEMQEVYQRYLAEDNTLTNEEIVALSNALRERFNAIFRQLPGKTYVRIANAWDVTYQPGENGDGNAVTDIKFYNDILTLRGKLFTRTGYTQTGWATVDGGEKVYGLDAVYTKNEALTLYPVWNTNKYTITFDTNGGSEIAPITQDYGTNITAPADPTREGYTFIGWDMEIPTTMPAENITLKARWRDTEKPTGEIIIGTDKWHEFLNTLTFGLFFKDTHEVTINAADNSGTVFVSYLVTDRDLSETELGSLVYRAYEEPFRIDPNGEYIVYAMLVDESLNITYLRSDRVTLDNVLPVIGGIEDGKTYCEAQTVTVDEKYVNTITVNGTAVELDENNSFILPAADGEQKIVAADKAGNIAEMTVTVHDGHTFGDWKADGDGTHSRECTVDGCNGLETKDCSGGKATCAEKAVCEVCKGAYGELDPKNHTALKHIPAKAATEDAEGNIEYWYCSGCNKYYSDKDGTKEIKKADTVTAKLPKSPPTGDNSNLMLWIALLLASGGAVIGTAVVSKKKKHSAE